MVSNTPSVKSLSTTDPSKRVTRCKPWSSSYHPLRVVNKLTMIRKSLARMLQAAAIRLETDTTKETLTATISATRVKLAALILPDDAAFTIDPSKIKH